MHVGITWICKRGLKVGKAATNDIHLASVHRDNQVRVIKGLISPSIPYLKSPQA